MRKAVLGEASEGASQVLRCFGRRHSEGTATDNGDVGYTSCELFRVGPDRREVGCRRRRRRLRVIFLDVEIGGGGGLLLEAVLLLHDPVRKVEPTTQRVCRALQLARGKGVADALLLDVVVTAVLVLKLPPEHRLRRRLRGLLPLHILRHLVLVVVPVQPPREQRLIAGHVAGVLHIRHARSGQHRQQQHHHHPHHRHHRHLYAPLAAPNFAPLCGIREFPTILRIPAAACTICDPVAACRSGIPV